MSSGNGSMGRCGLHNCLQMAKNDGYQFAAMYRERGVQVIVNINTLCEKLKKDPKYIFLKQPDWEYSAKSGNIYNVTAGRGLHLYSVEGSWSIWSVLDEKKDWNTLQRLAMAMS